MKANYTIERTCSNCRNKERISVSKREAAFELVDISKVLGQRCKKCSSTTFSTTFEHPDLDFELLKDWATNSDLHLMPQDEELFLADEKYLDYILKILDTVSISHQKINLLMDALCVIVYDNSLEENQQKDETLKKRVIVELNKRTEKLNQAEDWIMDYIKEVVYPQLELTVK
ncbi:MAG TPA: hypothetical protein VLZ83_13455 [Edaphocola sp.]|nr:hypothetical protein [Edaphocola sp.]